jgi:flavin reductase (DIM6/NTAB) family NADH-FMN oxidoreductase RutF
MSVTDDAFRQVLGTFATGVTIVTTASKEGVPYGLTVSAFTSVSLNPPMILVCLSNHLSGLSSFLEGGPFAVNILARGQEDLSQRFATKGSERQSHLQKKGVSGAPVLEAALARLECSLEKTIEAGDHTVLIGRVEHAWVSDTASTRAPLIYYSGAYRELG